MGMAENLFLHVVISLAILVFTAKVFAEIFHRFKLPATLY
jgi:Kef-type K+ transport system membrane component KefB